jgi:hypothetical protein
VNRPGRRRGPSLEQIATLCGVAIALASIPLAVVGQRQAAIAKARAWTAAGPPCPVVSRRAYMAFGAPVAQAFDYAGARFARAYGGASCSQITDDPLLGLGHVPVCQFNNPTVVEVTSVRGRTFFMTGIRPATILLAHGQARCVLAARLGDDWLRN